LAIDQDGAPVIIEYKWDLIDHRTIAQVLRYGDYLRARPQSLREALTARGQSDIDLNQLRAITIGHRYAPSVVSAVPPQLRVTFLRYGRQGGYPYLGELEPIDIEQGRVNEPAPREGKEHYLDKYRAETTLAVSEAFDELRRELEALGLTEKIHGKHRITYRAKPWSVTVTFRPLLLEMAFKVEGEVLDPDGRILRDGDRCSIAIASEADVEAAMVLLKRGIGIQA
jgi:hypothetical protein